MNEEFTHHHEVSPETIDDAVLALLSLCIVSENTDQLPGVQADPRLDPDSLERLHAKGFLACRPSLYAGRPVWLTPERLKRSRELFREKFKQ